MNQFDNHIELQISHLVVLNYKSYVNQEITDSQESRVVLNPSAK